MLLKRYSALLLSSLLVFTAFPNISLAADKGKFSSKDEVIYANLTPDGKTDEMYVVNSFQVTEPGELIDYGSYEDIRNLSDLSDITIKNDNEVHFEAEEDFFYQGTLKNQALPWDISITYLLDGKKIAPDDLAGASGQLEIQIKTSQNKKVDPVFFEYYLLQVAITFDPLHFENIQAPKGTEANEGKDKLMTFNVMPEQEDVLIATSDVTDFELEPIEISAVPADVGFDDPDTDELANEMQDLADAINDINKGVADLKDGASELSNGASELSNGSNEFLKGINELNNSSDELVSGSNEILKVFKQVNDVVGDAPEIPSDLDTELQKAPKNLRNLANELRDFSQVVNQFNKEIDKLPVTSLTNDDIKALSKILKDGSISQDIAEIIKQLEENEVDQEVIDLLKQLEEDQADPKTIDNALKQLEKMAQAMEDLQAIQEQIPDDSLSSIKDMAKELDKFADGLDDATSNISVLDELDEFKNGITELASEYQKFHDGLVTYTDGVDTLATSYTGLNKGTEELADGSAKLAEGMRELQEGTQELTDETSDLPDQFTSEIDEFMDEFDFSDFKPKSYVSEKNKDVGVVQFVLQTKKIELEEPEEKPVEEEEKKNIWTRFLDLFR